MNINFFGKVFVINLDRRTDRWAQCVEELKSCGIEEYERFPGFDHPTDGHSGCTRSHREILRQVAAGPWERVLVLEDDFCAVTLARLKEGGFVPESQVWRTHCRVLNGEGTLSERFGALQSFLPERWDVIYLGAGYGEPPIERLNEYVLRCGFMQTTSSYGITKSFAKTWTETVDRKMGSDDLERNPGPIDNAFGEMARYNLFYVFQPRLTYQRKSKSDITREENSYLFSMTDPVHENML